MDRTALLNAWYTDQLQGMRGEIATQLASPAKYLDAALTAGPTSGLELYERYEILRDLLRREFREFIERIPTRQYRARSDGSLLRRDLELLDRDIETLSTLIPSNYYSGH